MTIFMNELLLPQTKRKCMAQLYVGASLPASERDRAICLGKYSTGVNQDEKNQ